MPPTIFWNTSSDRQTGGDDGGDRRKADCETYRPRR